MPGPRKDKEGKSPRKIRLPLCDRCQGPMPDPEDQEDGRHYELKDCVIYTAMRLAVLEGRVVKLKREG